MKQMLACTALVATLIAPAAAEEQPEGRLLAELTFESADRHGKGYLHQGDMEAIRADIFESIDANDNGGMELAEFLGWGFGFQNIAEDENRKLAYDTALKVVFSFWDRNGDGKITQSEHRRSLLADFDRADVNGNAILEKSEFLGGFSVLVAIRAALKPE
ncbi:hypothetical protein [Hoeflea prorocentri]|uniref:EF-hand domain-containing protein n=1 Tax=Hoeflea prorocentri TaxID=1922333 RepID=A0A9X3ZJD6_9HYPH|nr:hypothetical protein [Hoeflea prorocentri]MCY6383354.1 hypothetical protein [Hoeflea prorocentri]MDA5401154.1 hypothetical protein [Hoeflea prorocentri]